MMRSLSVFFVFLFSLGLNTKAQNAEKIDFGDLQTGSTVYFTQSINGEWGLEIVNDGILEFSHPQPIVFEIQKESDKIQTFRLGYQDIQKQGESIIAKAIFTYGNVVFNIRDVWTIVESAMSLNRSLEVKGTESKVGFSSGIKLSSSNTVKFSELYFFAPGLFYADRHVSDNEKNKALGLIQFREDVMPTPCFGLFYPNGVWLSLIHKDLLHTDKKFSKEISNISSTIDESFEYGVLGVSENKLGGVELGFSLPGSIQSKEKNAKRISKYHPVKDGFKQSYSLVFQFGKNEFYRDMVSRLEQSIWEKLSPELPSNAMVSIRTQLADQLLNQVLKTGDITGLPMSRNAISGDVISPIASPQTIEAAALLIYESELDKTDRGRMFRRQGLNLIESKIKLLSMSPPSGETFDVRTGQLQSFSQPGVYSIHHISMEMSALMDLIKFERSKGRQHISWLEWARTYANWLLENQQTSGLFPLSMKNGSNELVQESGDLSYASIPFLVKMTEETSNRKYLAAALTAAMCVWEIQGNQSRFFGYDRDRFVTDKASGMYALEAFMTLYEYTKNQIWLDRAHSAAYYTLSWIQTWNAPVSSNNSGNTLKWLENATTIGLQSVYTEGFGLRDQSLIYAIPEFSRLYQLTGDSLMLKVIDLLVKSSSIMMESNEQKIGLKAPGWKIDRWNVGYLNTVSTEINTWRSTTTIQPLRGLMRMQLHHSDILKVLSQK